MTQTSWIVTIKHKTFKTRTYIFDEIKESFEFIIFASKHYDIDRITLKKWSIKV